jgi:formylglycine-generating enzyme required for sulfatase activity
LLRRHRKLVFAGVAGLVTAVLLLVALPLLTRKQGAPKGVPTARERPEEPAVPRIVTNSLGMKFVLVPAGTFTMGSSPEEIARCLAMNLEPWQRDCIKSEGPEHEVEITRRFYMAETEVTVGQFRRFVKDAKYSVGDERWESPGFDQSDDQPVVFVSWNNAVDFCAWLSQKDGKTYRLPTEAEWEYSCRAGAKTRYCFGDDESDLSSYAWIRSNSQGKTNRVKTLTANALGLCDMHGNVWEWCQDVYDPKYYEGSPKEDPPGPGGRGARVMRGGSWYGAAVDCRSAFRRRGDDDRRDPNLGFRIVLVISPR